MMPPAPQCCMFLSSKFCKFSFVPPPTKKYLIDRMTIEDHNKNFLIPIFCIFGSGRRPSGIQIDYNKHLFVCVYLDDQNDCSTVQCSSVQCSALECSGIHYTGNTLNNQCFSAPRAVPRLELLQNAGAFLGYFLSCHNNIKKRSYLYSFLHKR